MTDRLQLAELAMSSGWAMAITAAAAGCVARPPSTRSEKALPSLRPSRNRARRRSCRATGARREVPPSIADGPPAACLRGTSVVEHHQEVQDRRDERAVQLSANLSECRRSH